MVTSVVIPVFNESATLSELLDRVAAAPFDKEIVVVDDGSTDGSRELLEAMAAGKRLPATFRSTGGRGKRPGLKKNRLKILFQERNQGKGAAIRRGFAEAAGEVVIVQDADLEYDPNDIPKVTQPIVDGVADVVFGSRFVGTPRRVLYYWHTVVNRALTTLSNMTSGLNLTDMETCYKAFRRDVIQSFALEEDRFGIEPELTAKVARGGFRVYEVPISYHGRTYEEGKKIGWRDGVRALYAIAKYGIVKR